MASDPRHSPNGGGHETSAMAQAIQQVTANTQALIRDQLDLAKLEVQKKGQIFGRGAVIAAAAGLFVVGALILILFGFAYLAAYLVDENQIFWGFFVVAVILLILAALAGWLAAKAFQKARTPVPDEALAAARQTQATIQHETTLMKEQVREVVVKPEDQRQ